MTTRTREGKFAVIDSFAIKRRKEFYLIGQLIEGAVQTGWFVNIAFNNSLALTIRITTIEEVEISSEKNKYKLLIVQAENEVIDILLSLKIGSEFLDITIEGEE